MSTDTKTLMELELSELKDKAYHASISQEIKTEAELVKLSAMYERIGDLSLKLHVEEADQKAIEAYRYALKYRMLIKCEDTSHIEPLYLLYDKIANTYYKKGTPDALEQAGDAYLAGAVYKETLYKQTQDQKYLYLLAHVYEKMGGIQYIFGDDEHTKKAVSFYQRTLEYKQGLLTQHDEASLSALAALSYKLGQLYYRLGGPSHLHRALDAFEQARDYNQEITRIHETPLAVKQLANSYAQIGRIYMRLGEREGYLSAIEAYDQSISLQNSLNDDRINHQSTLAQLYAKRADAALAMHDDKHLEQACTDAKISLEIYRKLDELRKIPDSHEALSVAYGHLGDIYEASYALDEAREAYHQAGEILKKLLKQRTSARYQELLSRNCNKLGNLYFAKGSEEDLKKAAEIYLESIKLNKQLLMAGIITLRDQSIAYTNLANVYERLEGEDNFKQTVDYYQQGIDMMTTWCQEGHQDSWDELAGIHNALGHVYYRHEKWQEAREAYEAGLAVNLKIYQKANIEVNRRNLAISYTNLAHVYRRSDLNRYYQEMIDCTRQACELLGHKKTYGEERLLGIFQQQKMKNLIVKERLNPKKCAQIDVGEGTILAVFDFSRLRSYKLGVYFTAEGFKTSKMPSGVMIPYEIIKHVELIHHDVQLTFYNDVVLKLDLDKFAEEIGQLLSLIIEEDQ